MILTLLMQILSKQAKRFDRIYLSQIFVLFCSQTCLFYPLVYTLNGRSFPYKLQIEETAQIKSQRTMVKELYVIVKTNRITKTWTLPHFNFWPHGHGPCSNGTFCSCVFNPTWDIFVLLFPQSTLLVLVYNVNGILIDIPHLAHVLNPPIFSHKTTTFIGP